MLKAFKIGFGFTLGVTTATLVVNMLSTILDDKHMESDDITKNQKEASK